MITEQTENIEQTEEKKIAFEMPSIKGIDFMQAKDFLESVDLRLGRILFEESPYPRNLVIQQSVKPGESVMPETRINIRVSSMNPVRFLPSIFQTYDENNDYFLHRFLMMFQHILNTISIHLDNLDVYFNPLKTPSDFFPWLASWFAIRYDFAVADETMRLLVKEAVKLYQWRGTKIGIQKFLEIITGVKPEIIEHNVPMNEYIILEDRVVERPILGENNSLYNFVVSFPVPIDYFDVDTVRKINQICRLERPAHTNYFVIFAPDEKEKKKDYSSIGVDMIR